MEITPRLLISSPKARAVRALRDFVETNGLREGDRLPAESKLATEFNVSRMTLRSALSVLEREGLVRREHNLGCVCAVSSRPTGGLMARTIVLISDHLPAPDGRLFTGLSASVVSGVIDHVGRRGLNFLRINPNSGGEAWLKELIGVHPCGILLSCWKRPVEWQLDVLSRIRAQKIPVVVWNDSPLLDAFDSVASDHISGTEQLVRALVTQGKRRILRLWTSPVETPWIQAHNQGFEHALAERGVKSIPPVYVAGLTERSEPPTEANFRIRVRQFCGYLVEYLQARQPIDSIMVETDCETLAALAACRVFGREDIAVTGYDNYWQTAPERQWEPGRPFATVEKSNHLIGEQMVELLLQRIERILPETPQKRLIAQQVVT